MTVASTLVNPLVYTWWAMYSGPVIHMTSVTKETSWTVSAVVWKLWAMCLARSRISDLPNAELPWPILMCSSRRFFRTVALYSHWLFFRVTRRFLLAAESLACRSRALRDELHGPQSHFGDRTLPTFVRCSTVPHSIQHFTPVTGGCMLGGRLDEVVVAVAMEGAVPHTVPQPDIAFGGLPPVMEGTISRH